jgi:hypothetical protein
MPQTVRRDILTGHQILKDHLEVVYTHSLCQAVTFNNYRSLRKMYVAAADEIFWEFLFLTAQQHFMAISFSPVTVHREGAHYPNIFRTSEVV